MQINMCKITFISTIWLEWIKCTEIINPKIKILF